MVAVEGGEVRAELPLPVAGLLADAPLKEVISRSLRVQRRRPCARLERRAPVLRLSFLGLSVIPHLKITDRGLVDVDRFELVPLGVMRALLRRLDRHLRRRGDRARERLGAGRGRLGVAAVGRARSPRPTRPRSSATPS